MRGLCFILLIVTLVLNSCNQKEKQADSSALSAQSFEDGIEKSNNEVILDVRTPEEFGEGHIKDAILINFHDDDFTAQVNQIDKQLPVYVYCASGVRSDKAASILKEEGFKEVYVLKKGLNEWRAANKEIVR